MRQTFRKIVSVLDGQPGSVRGQSLVEMTITFPLLILMILGLVEIGFLANNYLVLMDVVRSAGRYAVTANPTADQWDDSSATYPESRNLNRLDCDQPGIDPADGKFKQFDNTFHRLGNGQVINNDPVLYDALDYSNHSMPGNSGITGPRAAHLVTQVPGYPIPNVKYWLNGADGKPHEGAFGFFDSVACQVTRGFAPLVFNDNDILHSRDDIVVSAVSYALMAYPTNSSTSAAFQNGPLQHVYPKTPSANLPAQQAYWVTVTGRYPTANRYCATVSGSPAVTAGDVRDPFDFLTADFNPQWTNGPSKLDLNPPTTGKYGEGAWDPVTKTYSNNLLGPSGSQGVRGFVFTGNSLNPDGCYGSRFTVQDIELRLNQGNETLNASTPNGGLVIVEVFWQYHPLVFGPLFEGFSNGNRMNDPVLWVYGIFPLPSVEPTATPSS